MQLRCGATVAQASSYSSNSTPTLGISRCNPKKKEGRARERKEGGEEREGEGGRKGGRKG